jgi:hypothetical protein
LSLIELTAFKILNTRTRINHTEQRIYFTFEWPRPGSSFLKTAHNRLNAIIRRDINAYREETWSKACESLDYRDGKKFWNKFKALTGQKSVPNHHLVYNAQTYHSPRHKTSCFAELLEEVHQVPHNPNFEDVFFQRITNNVNAFKNTSPSLFLTPSTTNI